MTIEKLQEIMEKEIKLFNDTSDIQVERVNVSPIYQAGTRKIISYNIRIDTNNKVV